MAQVAGFFGAFILGSSIIGNLNTYNKGLINITGSDNISYTVKNDKFKDMKVEILTELNNKVKILFQYFKKNNYFNNDRIKHLTKNYQSHKLSENVDNEYTSYSVNKGEEIKLCLSDNSASSNNITDDLNTAVFVLIHELAHIMTEEVGHPPKFWKNMSIILKHAIDCGIYNYVNYKENPVYYCGVHVKDTPYIK